MGTKGKPNTKAHGIYLVTDELVERATDEYLSQAGQEEISRVNRNVVRARIRRVIGCAFEWVAVNVRDRKERV